MKKLLSAALRDAAALARREVKSLIPRYRRMVHALVTSRVQIHNPAGKASTVFVESTPAYAAASSAGPGPAVFPAESRTKKLPVLAEPDLDYFQRRQVGSDPDQFVSKLRDLRLLGTFYFAFITARNELLLDFSFDPWGSRLHPYLSKIRLPKIRAIEGRSAVLMAVGSQNNYYHFTLDLMPQLRLLEAAGLDLSEIDHFVIHRSRASYQAELLAAAGIGADKILQVDDRDHLRLAEAVLPQRLVGENHVARWKLDYLRSLQRDAMEPGERRLFIGRKKASTRRLVNEQEIADYLVSRGFEVVEIDGLSVAEQARLFSQAGEIVGVHGAALTNILYCRPGARLVEIANASHPSTHYWAIADALGLDYALCPGRPAGRIKWQEPHVVNKQDFVVDPGMLKALVD